MTRKYRTPNWKYVTINDRDYYFFRTIAEQRFLKRDQAIKYVFEGNESYAVIRIRKLKKFGYLKAIPKAGECESYLLGKAGVEALKLNVLGGERGLSCPAPQQFIESATYEGSFVLSHFSTYIFDLPPKP